MFEIILENLSLIIAIILGSGGGIVGIWKWHTNAVENSFNEGKKEEQCLTRIEGKADEAINGVQEIDKKLLESVKKGDEHHERLYDKLDEHGKILTGLSKDIGYLRGKAENI